jgi:hypothetical protein
MCGETDISTSRNLHFHLLPAAPNQIYISPVLKQVLKKKINVSL